MLHRKMNGTEWNRFGCCVLYNGVPRMCFAYFRCDLEPIRIIFNKILWYFLFIAIHMKLIHLWYFTKQPRKNVSSNEAKRNIFVYWNRPHANFFFSHVFIGCVKHFFCSMLYILYSECCLTLENSSNPSDMLTFQKSHSLFITMNDKKYLNNSKCPME